MYSKVSLSEIEQQEVDDMEPDIKAVGYHLRPSNMRPSVWVYEEGESNNLHKQQEQEELYYVIEGSAKMEIDDEEIDLEEGDFVVVSPDSWRQITGKERCVVLVVGAPNVKDDHVVHGEE